MLTEKELLTTAEDAEVVVGGWNGIGKGGINGGMPGGMKPIGGGIKPTHVHATIFTANFTMQYSLTCGNTKNYTNLLYTKNCKLHDTDIYNFDIKDILSATLPVP